MKTLIASLTLAGVVAAAPLSAQTFEYGGTVLTLSYGENDSSSPNGEHRQLSSTTALSYGNFMGEIYIAMTDENFAGNDYATTRTFGLDGLYKFSDSFAAGAYARYNDSDLSGGGENGHNSAGLQMRGMSGPISYEAYIGTNSDKNDFYEDWRSAGLRGAYDISSAVTTYVEAQYDDISTGAGDFDVSAIKLGLTYDLASSAPSLGRPVYLTGEVSRWEGFGIDWNQFLVSVSVPLGNNAAKPAGFRGMRSLYTEYGY